MGAQTKTYLKSLGEMVAIAYATSFFGMMAGAGVDLFELGTWKAAGMSAFPAALATLYGSLARFKGDWATASVVDARSASQGS